MSNQVCRTIWLHPDNPRKVCILDQRCLPHEIRIVELETVEDTFTAIRDMLVRGAPLIGVTAGYGMYLAALHSKSADELRSFGARLASARPTAVNLQWAIQEQLRALEHVELSRLPAAALETARRIEADDIRMCRSIGEHGLTVIRSIYQARKRPVNILTHCNAGWLACVEWGTATAPIYLAHEAGIPVHVWVDETRPRNQGASLTAWELTQRGVPCTLIADNAGGLLMRQGKVDMAIVGTDRTTRNGDVANKIGTYLKALAAKADRIPFYVAVPSPSIDWNLRSGAHIPIEERDADEVKYMTGLCEGKLRKVLIAPESIRVSNYGFDVTPAELITGLITERGIAAASEEGLLRLFPERGTAGSLRDEGVIKFECRWTPGPALDCRRLAALLNCRRRLYGEGLIGVYPDGIGFGNLSIRDGSPGRFIISGSQTGHVAEAGEGHFTLVKGYDLTKNRVDCEGPVKASSESLTHAMIYETFPDAGAVIHVHNRKAWERLLGKVPTSGKNVPYGTPAMAAEIKRLNAEEGLGEKRILVMAGHEEGIISFGANPDEAEKVLMHFLSADTSPAR